MSPTWTTRTETVADAAAVRALTLAAFDTSLEAGRVDALREDPSWIDGLSLVAPRSGFGRASAHGIRVSVEVPDEALMALTLDEVRPSPATTLNGRLRRSTPHPLPAGTVRYAPPFGI